MMVDLTDVLLFIVALMILWVTRVLLRCTLNIKNDEDGVGCGFCRNRNTEQALAKEHMGINPAANISFLLITPITVDSKFKPMIPWTGIKCSNPPAARPGKSLGQYLT